MGLGLKKIIVVVSIIAMVLGMISISADKRDIINISDGDSVHDVLADAGRRMVLEGFSQDGNGKKYAKLSNHFVCTSCHNVVKENNDLTSIDPQERLDYAKENNLPFLQGSPLYGLVNRASFYNGDYVKKYGNLAKVAHNNIREAIQLCAVECAQGRRLKPWELESILAYLWTLALNIEDLQLTESEIDLVESAINDNTNQSEAVALLQSKYRKDSPATFGRPPDDMNKGYEYEGNPANGQAIYELGCQHCHENQRYSFFELDDSKLSFNYLQKHIKRHRRFSFYWVSRYGTKPKPGKKSYMPQYTEERMSDQQLEDLRSYIEMRAN